MDDTDNLPSYYKLITEEAVTSALIADKGNDVVLKSWIIDDFAKRGDNYASSITNVKVFYSCGEQSNIASYIVKMNPGGKAETLDSLTESLFKKETDFYRILVPLLNKFLTDAKQVQLRIPKFFYADLTPKKEILFLEDLRIRGFEMQNRKKGLDVAHTILILQELTRLHAASALLQLEYTSTNPDYDIKKECSFLNEIYTGEGVSGDFIQVLLSMLENGAFIASSVPGYEGVVKWLKNQDPQQILKEQLSSSSPFKTICHGDCWINNAMFRYDEFGSPCEVNLIDFQLVRCASPSTDLNYFLHTSLNGPDRRKYLLCYLSIYYSTYCGIFASAGHQPPFTLEDLHKEYKDKNLYGLICVLIDVPNMIMNPEDVPDFASVADDEVDSFMKELREKTAEKIQNNPLLRPRFLDILDDMINSRVIKFD